MPTLVKTVGTTAFVSTTGVGLQQVDLNAVAHKNRYAVQFSMGQYGINATQSWDISAALAGIATLAPQNGSAGFVAGAVRGRGVVAWAVTGGLTGPRAAGCQAFPAGVSPSGAMRLAIYPAYAYPSSATNQPTTTTLRKAERRGQVL